MLRSCLYVTFVSHSSTGDKPKNGILTDNAVPHIFNWTKLRKTTASCNRAKSTQKRNERDKRRQTEEVEAYQNVGNSEEITAVCEDSPEPLSLCVTGMPNTVINNYAQINHSIQRL